MAAVRRSVKPHPSQTTGTGDGVCGGEGLWTHKDSNELTGPCVPEEQYLEPEPVRLGRDDLQHR